MRKSSFICKTGEYLKKRNVKVVKVMRPLWKGAVSFGLVFVPVKLYTATESRSIKFNYLHEKCKTPIKYRRYCPYCDTEVPMDEIVRGYEYERGKYVVIREEDLESLPDRASKNIDILDFVNLSQVDPVYYQKAYYLVPDSGGEKVYELLKEAMKRSGRVAVARVTIRTGESLAILRVACGSLMMNTMFYPDEVRRPEELPEMKYRVNLHEKELKMAENLINSLSAEFRPEKYTDEYRRELMDLIQAKIAGKEIEVPEAALGREKVVDLMEALKASIELAEKERKAGKERKKVKKEKAGR